MSQRSELALTVTTDAKLTSITQIRKICGPKGPAGGAAGELTKVGRRGSECVSSVCIRGLAAPGVFCAGLAACTGWQGYWRIHCSPTENATAPGKRGGVVMSKTTVAAGGTAGTVVCFDFVTRKEVRMKTKAGFWPERKEISELISQ